jgi:ribosomal protein S3AE
MPTKETWVEVDVSLDDFSDDDLIEEMENRGLALECDDLTGTELITAIYHKRRLGQDYQRELDQLIYLGTGRII